MEVFPVLSEKLENETGGNIRKMLEKNFAVVMKMLPEKWKQVEDYLDSIGATVIFVKQASANRKLVVKNLPDWKEEKENERNDSLPT